MLKKVAHNAGAIGVGQVLNIAGNIALVPFFIVCWSSPVYGEWIALSALVAYLSTLDMGMNAAAGNSLLAAYAKEDWAQYKALQSSALAFYIVVAVVITAVVGAACVAFPISHLLGITYISQREGALIVWILASTLMWQMAAAQIWNIYRTTGELAKSQWLWNLQFFGGLLATAIVLLFRGRPLDVAFWTFLPMLVSASLAWIMIRRLRPWLLPDIRAANWKDLRRLFGPSSLFGLMTISLAIGLNGPVILVSRGLGGTAVALLVTTRTMTTSSRQFTQVLTTSLWPEVTRLYVLEQHRALQRIHRILTAIVVAVCCGLASTLWFEGSSVIAVWTRERLQCDQGVLRLFVVAAVLNAPWIASSVILAATNRHRGLAWSYFLSSIVCVATIWMLLPNLGLKAVPVGVIAGEAMACYHHVVKSACAVVREPYLPYALRLWATVIAAAGAGWIAAWVWHHLGLRPQVIQWITTGLVAMLASTSVTALCFLSSVDRRRMHSAIGGRLRSLSMRLQHS